MRKLQKKKERQMHKDIRIRYGKRKLFGIGQSNRNQDWLSEPSYELSKGGE